MQVGVVTVCLVFLAASVAGFTATTVPFGGIAAPSSLGTQSTGQIVTGISDIVSFSFWVAAIGGAGGDSATAAIAQWTGTTAGSVLGSTTVTLPTGAGYTQVTATLNVVNLDPTLNYVIYITTNVPTPAASTHYDFFATYSTATTGGLAKATGSVWSSGYNQDAQFSLSFNSVLSVNPSTNYAEGPGTGSWYCALRTYYKAIQVNWQTLKVNTVYAPGVSSTTQLYGASGCSNGLIAPYGTAADCWDITHMGADYGNIDLTGTHYAVNDVFTGVGYFGSGTATFTNNNQSVALEGQGDCGWIATAAANNDGEDYALGYGGFYLQLKRI